MRGSKGGLVGLGLVAAVLLAAPPVHGQGSGGTKPGPGQAGAAAVAQNADPALHRRSAAQPDGVPQPVIATGRTSLPPEAEGEYPWNKSGGEIDVYFEDGRLHGYMTDHPDPDPHAAPVTLDFAVTHVDGAAVEWTTRAVHGVSYSFAGHLERGLAGSPSLPGYYLLTGTLTEHDGQAGGANGDRARTVSLKREPGTP